MRPGPPRPRGPTPSTSRSILSSLSRPTRARPGRPREPRARGHNDPLSPGTIRTFRPRSRSLLGGLDPQPTGALLSGVARRCPAPSRPRPRRARLHLCGSRPSSRAAADARSRGRLGRTGPLAQIACAATMSSRSRSVRRSRGAGAEIELASSSSSLIGATARPASERPGARALPPTPRRPAARSPRPHSRRTRHTLPRRRDPRRRRARRDHAPPAALRGRATRSATGSPPSRLNSRAQRASPNTATLSAACWRPPALPRGRPRRHAPPDRRRDRRALRPGDRGRRAPRPRHPHRPATDRARPAASGRCTGLAPTRGRSPTISAGPALPGAARSHATCHAHTLALWTFAPGAGRSSPSRAAAAAIRLARDPRAALHLPPTAPERAWRSPPAPDITLPPPPDPARPRLRLGVLLRHLGPVPETRILKGHGRPARSPPETHLFPRGGLAAHRAAHRRRPSRPPRRARPRRVGPRASPARPRLWPACCSACDIERPTGSPTDRRPLAEIRSALRDHGGGADDDDGPREAIDAMLTRAARQRDRPTLPPRYSGSALQCSPTARCGASISRRPPPECRHAALARATARPAARRRRADQRARRSGQEIGDDLLRGGSPCSPPCLKPVLVLYPFARARNWRPGPQIRAGFRSPARCGGRPPRRRARSRAAARQPRPRSGRAPARPGDLYLDSFFPMPARPPSSRRCARACPPWRSRATASAGFRAPRLREAGARRPRRDNPDAYAATAARLALAPTAPPPGRRSACPGPRSRLHPGFGARLVALSGVPLVAAPRHLFPSCPRPAAPAPGGSSPTGSRSATTTAHPGASPPPRRRPTSRRSAPRP